MPSDTERVYLVAQWDQLRAAGKNSDLDGMTSVIDDVRRAGHRDAATAMLEEMTALIRQHRRAG